jgi:outer membrane lipase/esterase
MLMESLMKLFRDLRRLGAILLAPVALSAALLSACGGGTSQVDPFNPQRLIVLGDESSVIDGDGRKYAMNDERNANVLARCLDLPTIAQMVASQYGFVFEQCNPTGAVPRAFIFAEVDAKVGGLAGQIVKAKAFGLGPTDLVTVMIGTNDIIDLYESVQAGRLTSAEAVDQAKNRGRLAAAQISDLLATGAKALVMTVPDLSQSPYATAAARRDPNARALLNSISYDYNGTLRTSITPNDGRYFGLVLADDAVTVAYNSPTDYLSSPANVTEAACSAPFDTGSGITRCAITNNAATTTLVPGANTGNYLWAGDRYLGPVAQDRIGQQARTRAINNPF